MLLEATWESPAIEPEAPIDAEERVAVPKLELDQGGLSRAAAQALFGH